jgi:hypothetical protein
VECADRVEQHVEREVLGGGDMDFAGALAGAEEIGEAAGTFQKRQGMGQKEFTLARQRPAPPRPALLVIQFRLQPRFQGDEPVPHPLLGEMQVRGGSPQAAPARQFHECRHLIRRQRNERLDHTVYRCLLLTKYNVS